MCLKRAIILQTLCIIKLLRKFAQIASAFRGFVKAIYFKDSAFRGSRRYRAPNAAIIFFNALAQNARRNSYLFLSPQI